MAFDSVATMAFAVKHLNKQPSRREVLDALRQRITALEVEVMRNPEGYIHEVFDFEEVTG